MYSISEISSLTGITAFTLRYYEKIGLLPGPRRQGGKPNGIRRYDDGDLRYIRFIHGLKHTGMKLEDIAAFTESGCLLTSSLEEMDQQKTLRRRVDILDRHLGELEEQMKQLEAVRDAAQEKRRFYEAMITELELERQGR